MDVHRSIKPLYYISRIICLWPFGYNKDKSLSPLNRTERILKHILNISMFFWVLWGYYFKVNHLTVIEYNPLVLEEVFVSPLHIFVFFSIAWSNSQQSKFAQEFFNQLHYMDKNKLLIPSSVFFSLRKKLAWTIVVIFVIIISSSTVDIIYIYQVADEGKAKYHIVTYTNYACLIFVVLQIINKTDLLKLYFKNINDQLDVIVQNRLKLKQNLQYWNDLPKSIRNLNQAYTQLCDLVKLNSKIHGMQIVIIFYCLTSLMLFSLYYGLLFGLGNNSHHSKEGIEYGLAATHIFIFSKHMIIIVMISKKCVAARDEAIQTRILIHKLLTAIPVDSQSSSSKVLCKRELNLFAQAIMLKNPEFSASGFFLVNYDALFTVISNVLCYFITFFQWQSSIQYRI